MDDYDSLSDVEKREAVALLRKYDEDTHKLLEHISGRQDKISEEQSRIRNYGLGIAAVLTVLYVIFGSLIIDAIRSINNTVQQQLVIVTRLNNTDVDIEQIREDIRELNKAVYAPRWGNQKSQDSEEN